MGETEGVNARPTTYDGFDTGECCTLNVWIVDSNIEIKVEVEPGAIQLDGLGAVT